MLIPFGPELYLAEGPTVSFLGFPYPTRMAVARLRDGSLWVWSPIALTEDLDRAIQGLGPVRHIVSPNKIHHLFLSDWVERWPDARLYAPPGLIGKRPDLRFHAELNEAAKPAWAGEIDPVVFRGSWAMTEVVFFHRASGTAIFGDLIQRHAESRCSGWKGLVMRLDGLVGQDGGTPREWRMSFFRRAAARQARAAVLAWRAERLLIAHGECAQAGAQAIIAKALDWI